MGEPSSDDLDVAAWLAGLGMQDYAAAFAANDVDAETLRHLTADDLRELGVTSIGHRRKLLTAIAALVAAAAHPVDQGLQAGREHVIGVQRRQVTTLFSDLVGFTGLSRRLDPEVMHELLHSYIDVCTRTIARHDGHVIRAIGDGVLATFGYPRARDGDAVRAVRAALELVDAVGRIEVPGGGRLSARAGLATGLVVAGESPVERDSLVGEAPNLAARLQGEAEPGQVLIAHSTANLIGGQFVCEAIGSRMLKGFAEPIPVVRVLSEARSQSRFEATRRATRLPMVGRVAETARLMERAAMAQSGQGQVVIIEGDAGIGKSRLVVEVTQSEQMSDRQRLLFQTSPHNLGTPFYPVIKFIEYAADLLPTDAPDVRFSKVADTLRQFGSLPDDRLALVAEILGIETPQRALLAGFASRELRPRAMRTLVDLAMSIAARGALIVVEDLQWADPSTRELLGMVIPRLATVPALTLITMRPMTAADPRPAWANETHVTRVTLDKLAADEIRALVGSIIPAGALGADLVEAVVSRSDGVPIFAEELAYAVLDAGSPPPAPRRDTQSVPTIPSTLTESLLARLDRLTHGLETAQLAAVIGREVPMDLLVAVSSLNEAVVRAAIDELIGAGILVRHETTIGEAVAFRQSLVRDCAYGLVLHRDRQRLHSRIAETATTHFPEMVERWLDFVPRHLEASADQQAAIAAWRQAGRSAAQQSAVGEAVAHFGRALAICRRLPEGRARDDLELTILTELVFPTLALRGWNSPEAATYVDRAIVLSAQVDSRHRIIPVLMGKWLTGISTGSRAALRTLAAQIVEAGHDGSEIDRLLVFRVMSSQYLFEGAQRDALREFNAFKALYDPERHEAQLGSGATNHAVTIDVGLATCLALMGRFEEMRRVCAAAIGAARSGGHFSTMCQTIAAAGGFCALLEGDAKALARYATELAEISERWDLLFWRPHADLFAGLAAVMQGDTPAGLARARDGIEGLIAGRAFVLSAWVMFYATACEEASELAEARRALAVAQPVIEAGERWFEAEFLRVRGRLHLSDGEDEAARADLKEAMRVAQAQGATLFETRALADLERMSVRTT